MAAAYDGVGGALSAAASHASSVDPRELLAQAAGGTGAGDDGILDDDGSEAWERLVNGITRTASDESFGLFDGASSSSSSDASSRKAMPRGAGDDSNRALTPEGRGMGAHTSIMLSTIRGC